MLRELCDDACNTALTESNRAAPDWGCNPFSSENSIASIASRVLAVLTLTMGLKGPLDFSQKPTGNTYLIDRGWILSIYKTYLLKLQNENYEENGLID